jgi:hypothetical protein
MDHNEARQTMASERYLLGELTPSEIDAFEEHMFDCSVCAMDVRAADAFVREAKEQLQHLPTPLPVIATNKPAPQERKKINWFFLFRPVFATPVFATLLGLIAYQNLSVIPHLQSEASAPRIPSSFISFHVGARGGDVTPLRADRKEGAVVLVQLPRSASYSSYVFDLYDASHKKLWSRTSSAPDPSGDGTLPLAISPIGLQSGSYTLAIAGVSPDGERTEIDRRNFDVHVEP